MTGNVPQEDNMHNAPADTLLGQLQRGRGLGYLRALQERPEVVRPLLGNCITNDPRWDTQVETRAGYYACLAVATRMSLAPIEDYLRSVADTRTDDQAMLALATLGSLGCRGDRAAVKMLRDYISYGTKWDVALGELAEVPDLKDIGDLAKAICARFPSGEQMDASFVYGHFHRYEAEPLTLLWDKLSQAEPCAARLINEARQIEFEQPRNHMRHSGAQFRVLPIDDVLARASQGNQRLMRQILLTRLDKDEVSLCTEAFAHNNPFAWWVAFECLTVMNEAAPYYEAILNRLVAYLELQAEPERPSYRRGRRAVEQVLRQLPPDMTLPLARRWYVSPEWHLQVTGERVLEEHATADDIPAARDVLSATLQSATPENADIYRVCSALDILARFPDTGLLPEVEAAFMQAGYSYARLRAARAMRANAPDLFAEGYAYECLWDCQEETRKIGCKAVSLALPDAKERLQALSEDVWEEQGIREAARARLQASE